MSTYGNNLLAQYYAQNQFKYIDNPELWIEADSWGTSTWTNKGNGGYDLTVYNGLHGYVQDDAIIANRNNRINVGVTMNVVGGGSFTIESVVSFDPSQFYATTNGIQTSFLFNQRSTANNPAGSYQVFAVVNDGTLYGNCASWNADGQNVLSGLKLPFQPDTTVYIADVYDAESGVYYHRLNNDVSTLSAKLQITNANTVIGSSGFTTLVNQYNFPFIGSIYSLRIYRRALSQNEIVFNKNMDRRRFGF